MVELILDIIQEQIITLKNNIMRNWITISEYDASNLTSKIDADSIINYGPYPGETAKTIIRTVGGHTLKVSESPAILESRINSGK